MQTILQDLRYALIMMVKNPGFAAITVLSWRYLFLVPVIFCGVITVCLFSAAWLAGRKAAAAG